MRELYHYTHMTHLKSILADGYLKTVESNVSERREHAGPDVVWLTTDGTVSHHHGMFGKVMPALVHEDWDKLRVRFTVSVPNRYVHKWSTWALAQGITSRWREVLIDTGGGPEATSTWRVVERRIPSSEWVEVRDMHTDEVLWKR